MTSSQTLYQSSQEIGIDVIAVFSRVRGNKILERLTVKDSNTPHPCDYRYNVFPDICPFSQVDALNHQYVPEE